LIEAVTTIRAGKVIFDCVDVNIQRESANCMKQVVMAMNRDISPTLIVPSDDVDKIKQLGEEQDYLWLQKKWFATPKEGLR
jgi:hypothetical protein